jgi:hypothetical protein
MGVVLPSIRLVAALLLIAAAPASAKVFEPKEIKAAGALKSGDGAVRLSFRSQRQFIETAFLYLVEVLPDGSDGPRTLQFERGAGLPLMGTNMIDPKPKLYRVPAGRYRLLAYTLGCQGVPPAGATCSFRGVHLPTGRYASGSPTIDVTPGALTDAGDFIIEYTPAVDLDRFDLFDDKFTSQTYDVRWRPLADSAPAEFGSLAKAAAPVVPDYFRSRIECEVRPRNYTVQFPFRCPAATAP